MLKINHNSRCDRNIGMMYIIVKISETVVLLKLCYTVLSSDITTMLYFYIVLIKN